MRRFLLVVVATLAVLLFPSSALAGFAPADRQTFQCVTNTDCPGPAFVTFDSFTDSPAPDRPNNGDERGFFELKDAVDTSTLTGFGDSMAVHDGQKIMLRVYIHNNANPNILGTEGAKAHNTQVLVQLPATNGTSNTATAFISAGNAQPIQISDTVSLNSSVPFSLVFDQNSPVNMTTRADNGDGDFVTNQFSGGTFDMENGVSRGFHVNLGDFDGGFKHHESLTFTAVVHTSTTGQNTGQVSFSCSALDVNTINRTRATFTAHSIAQNAVVNSYTFTVKDNSGQTVDTVTVNSSSSTAVYNFNQTNPGTYVVTTVVTTDKGGTAVAACSKQITVTSQPVTLSASTTSTPTDTETLPNTGAGGVVGVFTGISLLGAAGHYILNRRKVL